jgi:hypothetical protein
VIELRWKTKIDISGKKYIGMRLDWHYNATTPHLYIDLPTTVPDAIAKFYPNGPPKGARSPQIYVQPTFGNKPDLSATVDDSAPATAEDKTFIMQVTGIFLYYSRLVDHTMLPAVRAISEQQSAPTVKTLEAAHRLLRYAVSHPNHRVKFEACDMVLQVQSDASHLSLPKSGSVCGGYHYCSNKDDPFKPNGTIMPVCCRIKTVCAAASESEYASLFINGQQGYFERVVCGALGYPQDPTTLWTDNTTAEGIATDSCKLKRSKSMEMKYNWTRDKVRLGTFRVAHCKGKDIDADFFTKPQPVHKHQYFITRFVHPPAISASSG